MTEGIWKCPLCGEEYNNENENEAWMCCGEVRVFCGECFEEHSSEKEAWECCEENGGILTDCEHCSKHYKVYEEALKCPCHKPIFIPVCRICGKRECEHVVPKAEGQMELF